MCASTRNPKAVKTFLNKCFADCEDAFVLFEDECGAFGTAYDPADEASEEKQPPVLSSPPDGDCFCITVRSCGSASTDICNLCMSWLPQPLPLL